MSIPNCTTKENAARPALVLLRSMEGRFVSVDTKRCLAVVQLISSLVGSLTSVRQTHSLKLPLVPENRPSQYTHQEQNQTAFVRMDECSFESLSIRG